MDNSRLDKEKRVSTQNKISISIIMIVALIIGITYACILFTLMNSQQLETADILMFIKIFDVILAGLAAGSCVLCYGSTKKEELFIFSLIHIIFFVDIAFGNVDSMNFNDSTENLNNYIFMATSLLRVGILLISISPLKKIKKLIVNNKIKSVIIVLTISILIGILKNIQIISLDFKSIRHFAIYNIFLAIVYAIASVVYLLKSIKQNEYIYSVISASTFVFTIKWLYSVVGSVNSVANIKLVSISITYIGFIIFIGGIICEFILIIKRNKALESELEIFKKIADESRHNCIVIYDELGNIGYANNTAKEYYSNNSEVTISELQKISKLDREDIPSDTLREIENHILQVGYWKGSIEVSNGEITLSTTIQSISLDNNKKNIVVIFNDISERLRAKRYVLEYEKMKNQEQIRSEFFANISHELRTPLNIFYSTIQLLDMKSKKNPENFNQTYSTHKQCLKINCQRMLRLINNIVDITKIDVGFTKPKFINCDIVRLVEDITISVVNYARPKKINIVFDTDIEEHIIKCDIDMIERAMLNLLSNCIKFTNQNGNVLVKIYADNEWVHIIIKDDGIGIPIEVQGTIFERFVQSDKSLTRLNEGSGIGLSIVYSIVKLNEGEIYLDSDEENGTEFEILLPNKKLEGYSKDEDIYKIDIQKIELELSDIYELYQ